MIEILQNSEILESLDGRRAVAVDVPVSAETKWSFIAAPREGWERF
jgi:hypothetical protein